MNQSIDNRSRVIFCRGARATERRLLHEIDASLGNPPDLARPLRIIVPSKSLRHHVLRTIVRHCGPVLGVVVQTAFGAAREIVESAAAPTSPGDGFFELVVRRLAGQRPELAGHLEPLEDGFGTVVGVARDLLDAGFHPANEDAVLERFDDLDRPVTAARIDRARAVVWVAARAFEAMDATGAWRRSQQFQTAEEILARDGAPALAASTVLVHGFADVTGLVADFLVRVSKELPTTVLIDRPDRPNEIDAAEPGSRFLDRFSDRFGHLETHEDVQPPAPALVTLTEAADCEDEARWVSERIFELLTRGVGPEEIGVVARTLDGVALPLRRHLRRLGVPFSGVGASVHGGADRRSIDRVMQVLGDGPHAAVDLWFDQLAVPGDPAELALGLRQLGVQRLADLAAYRDEAVERRGVALLFDLRIGGGDALADERPRLSGPAMQQAVAKARGLLESFGGWTPDGTSRVHAQRTLEIVGAMSRQLTSAAVDAIVRATWQLADELEVFESVERREWLRALADRLATCGAVPIGGHGAGVQVLNVTEARARTFAHLFIIAFNRGVFPRIGGDDALFPDAIRARIATDVLSEMPVRARSADEERYLFSQLVSSASEVAISWSLSSAGTRSAPSPYVAEFLPSGAPSPTAPGLWAACRGGEVPRTPFEHAIIAAEAHRKRLAGTWEIAFAEVFGGRDGLDAGEMARARVDILDSSDPESRADTPNPWFGFIGPVLADQDSEIAITHLEDTATCPLQAYVTRRLRVVPIPDPQVGLPDPGGRLVGIVVHRVLESLVLDVIGEPSRRTLDQVLDAQPVDIPWPDGERLENLLVAAARRTAVESGFSLRGMATLLAARARPFVEVARSFEWFGGGSRPGVVGTEVDGRIEIPSIGVTIGFRADRVDLDERGPVLTDYKTGKLLSEKKQEPTRLKHLRQAIATGRNLQAAVYARSAETSEARGRYVGLKPDIKSAPEAAREALVEGDDEIASTALVGSVATIMDARRTGAFFPRVEEVGSDKLPSHCKFCPVKDACRREDSEFRRRLVNWMQTDDPDGAPEEAAARRLWHLGTGAGDPS